MSLSKSLHHCIASNGSSKGFSSTAYHNRLSSSSSWLLHPSRIIERLPSCRLAVPDSTTSVVFYPSCLSTILGQHSRTVSHISQYLNLPIPTMLLSFFADTLPSPRGPQQSIRAGSHIVGCSGVGDGSRRNWRATNPLPRSENRQYGFPISKYDTANDLQVTSARLHSLICFCWLLS